LHRAVERIIADRRRSGEDRGDFLSSLFALRQENGAPLSDREMRDEVMTMLIAGHETTAGALTWMFYELARNPDVMERARQEAQRVLDDRDPALDDLERMPLAMQIWKETLRLYPSADTMSVRVALRDVEIGGFHIKKGTLVLISPDVLHQREDVFPDALQWRPGTLCSAKRTVAAALLLFAFWRRCARLYRATFRDDRSAGCPVNTAATGAF
jgi:cytochrome P450